MPEETQPDATTVTSAVTENTVAVNGQVEQRIPKSRFDEVNTARKVAEDKLAAIEKQQQVAAQADALKKGEFEKVIADLEPKAKRVDALEATLKEYLEKEVAGIPEAMRDLIPAGDVTAQLAWIIQAKAKNLFSRTPAPGTDAGETGDKKPPALKLTDEQKKMALKSSMTEEQFITAYNLTSKGK